ncbi:hypothetical protein AAVH_09998 [Aphelenchoides avenae]|nr:hypothetical protein AAVH_09998 [Aphelenchus avenae]
MNPSPGFEEAAHRILRNLNWTRPDGSVPAGFGSYMAEPKIAVYLAMFTFTSVSSYGTVLWSQWRTIEYLRSMGTAMTATRRAACTQKFTEPL